MPNQHLRLFALARTCLLAATLAQGAQAATFGLPEAAFAPRPGDAATGEARSVTPDAAAEAVRRRADFSGVASFEPARDGPLAAALVAIQRAIGDDLRGARSALAAVPAEDALPGGEAMLARALIARSEGRLAEAAALADEVLAQQPDHAYAFNLRGTIAYLGEGPEAALPFFLEASRQGPAGALYWSNLGATLIVLARPAEAREALARAAALDPGSCAALLALGMLDMQAGQPEVAAGRHATCLAADSENTDAATGLVAALTEAGRIEEARAALDQNGAAIESRAYWEAELTLRAGEPETTAGLLDRVRAWSPVEAANLEGRLHLVRGDLAAAEDAFAVTLRARPGDPLALAGQRAVALAEGAVPREPATRGARPEVDALFEGLGLLSAAAPGADVRRAIEAGAVPGLRLEGLSASAVADLPADLGRALAVPLVLRLTSTAGAGSRLEELAASHAEAALVQYLAAEAMWAETRKAEPVTARLEAALALEGDFVAAHLLRAEVALAERDLARALTAYRAASAVAPAPDILIRAGLLAERLGRQDEAEAAYRQYAELAPDDYVALNQLAWFLVSREPDAAALDEAEGLADRALALRPGNAAILDTLGWIAFLRGDAEGAFARLQEAVAASGGGSPEILLHYAEAALAAGRRGEAAAALAPLLAGDAGAPAGAKLRELARGAGLVD